MINLARTFSRRTMAEQPSPVPPSPDRSKEQNRAFEDRERALAGLEAQIAAREVELTARERRLLEAEAVFSYVAEPSHDISALLSNIDWTVAPKTREESAERAKLIVSVWQKWSAPALEKSRDAIAQEAVRALARRQEPLRAERLEREQVSKALADEIIATGRKFGSRVLASDE
jgi:hypothetical protein